MYNETFPKDLKAEHLDQTSVRTMETLQKEKSLRLYSLLSGYIVDKISSNRSFINKVPDDIMNQLIQFMQNIKLTVYQQISYSIKDICKSQTPSLDSLIIGQFNGEYSKDLEFTLQAFLTNDEQIAFRVKTITEHHCDIYVFFV